jgi:hypothetical protein
MVYQVVVSFWPFSLQSIHSADGGNDPLFNLTAFFAGFKNKEEHKNESLSTLCSADKNSFQPIQ